MKRDTALILGNGPSLDQLNPALLKNFYTIGTNNIWAKFTSWEAETDAVIIVDAERIKEIGARYRNYSGELYVGHLNYIDPPIAAIRKSVGRDFIPVKQLMVPNPRFWGCLARYKIRQKLNGYLRNRIELSFDLTKGFLFASSVVVPAVQLAAAMGYKRILLHGVDASYAPKASHAAGIVAKQHIPARVFDYNFRADFEPWLVKAQIYFEQMGVELIDCTPGGKLRFITKGRLEDYC